MIMMIGTGHVFNIAEQVSFIIKNLWPEAVLVELDERRFIALTQDKVKGAPDESVPKLYKESARYQDKMSEKNGVQTGGELLAAINTGKLVGAEIVCIDKNAEQTMKELEAEMTFFERTRYSMSGVTDTLLGKRRMISTRRKLVTNEEEYIGNMRKRFPTLVRKLIDERNEYMAEQIRQASEKYNKMVVVVGDAHVGGLCRILNDLEIETVRLAELMDKDSMDRIRSRVWSGNNES